MRHSLLKQITILIVNYRTYDLTKIAIESLLQFYPHIAILVIDNGSHDTSTSYIMDMAQKYKNITYLINHQNIYHGPAMDQGIRHSQTKYLFTLDSDCQILKAGFLEAMLSYFDTPNLYAVGQLIFMNRYGYATQTRFGKRIKYIHPYAMLLDRQKYLGLKPFVHHGSPCIYNMEQAEQAGYNVQKFSLSEFIFHYKKGTCSRYGYGLGIKTSLELLLHKLRFFS